MRLLPLSGVLLLSSTLITVASAASFDQMVVFGDSLSDNGNVAIATGNQFPGPNYAPGRFTDGPNTTPATSGPQGLWVEQLAGRLGVSVPQPALAGTGGTNFAFASASTGSNNLYNITDQVNLYGLSRPAGANPNALYTIWGGANDLFNGTNTPEQAASNLFGNIQTLAAGGAKNFLWLNLPPLGYTPRGIGEENVNGLNTAAEAFNLAWSSDIQTLRGLGINVVGVDIYSLFTSIVDNPASYGLTNIDTPAQGLAGVNPNNYLFWDIQHPTTAGHALVADAAYNSLNAAAVPEPATEAFALLGLVGVVAMSRARKVRSGGLRRRADN